MKFRVKKVLCCFLFLLPFLFNDIVVLAEDTNIVIEADGYSSDTIWGIWSYHNGTLSYDFTNGLLSNGRNAWFIVSEDTEQGYVRIKCTDDEYSNWRDVYYAPHVMDGIEYSAYYCNVPIFKEQEDWQEFMDTGIIDDFSKLDMRFNFFFYEDGYPYYHEPETEGYEEDIGYPLNFEFHNYNWAMSKDRWCTWSTGEFDVDEDLRCEIYYNCQVSQYYEAFSEAVYFTVPKRALSFSDNTAVSCLSNSKSMSDMCTDQILPYLREHNDTEYDIDGGLTGILKLRTLQNLEVWARFYYVDASDYKHYGNWVKWTKDGVKVLKDKSQLADDEEEDNTEDSEKKSSTDGYVKTDDGTDPDKTSDTEDIEGVPTSIEDDSSSSGSSGSSSGSSSDSGSGFSITDALEFLGKILSGLAEFVIGAIKTFVTFIADLLSGVVEIVESVADVSNVFGVLIGWLPVNMQAVLGISVAVAVFLRILRR